MKKLITVHKKEGDVHATEVAHVIDAGLSIADTVAGTCTKVAGTKVAGIKVAGTKLASTKVAVTKKFVNQPLLF